MFNFSTSPSIQYAILFQPLKRCSRLFVLSFLISVFGLNLNLVYLHTSTLHSHKLRTASSVLSLFEPSTPPQQTFKHALVVRTANAFNYVGHLRAGNGKGLVWVLCFFSDETYVLRWWSVQSTVYDEKKVQNSMRIRHSLPLIFLCMSSLRVLHSFTQSKPFLNLLSFIFLWHAFFTKVIVIHPSLFVLFSSTFTREALYEVHDGFEAKNRLVC